MSRFEIQHFTLCDGWVNTWSDDDEQPITYATQEEAEAELAEFLAETEEAVAEGDLSSGYTADEFRIRPVAEGATLA